MNNNREIEARFLNIDVLRLKQCLLELGATDHGEVILEEIIIYDSEFKWRDVDRRFIRLRRHGSKTLMTYKHHLTDQIDGVEEIEFEVSDLAKAKLLIERIGLVPFRHQEKRRHSFIFQNVKIDFDTWPGVPTYVELEGENEDEIKNLSSQLGFNWKEAVFDNAKIILEKVYAVPVGSLRWFTFSRIE